MLISREILNERLGRTSEATIGLRDGQVVLGKVHKIFPNNRAEVQIGSHRFIAEIETPLAVGERYIFQVNHKGDQLIHLKVIGTQINEIKPENITALLRQINVRVNDVSITFVQSLMNERIPFIPRELVDALQLMDRVGHSPAVQTLIKELMIHKLPLQEGVLQSLLAFNKHNLSQSLTNALSDLNTLPQSQSVNKLQSLIRNLLQPSTAEKMGTLPLEQIRPIVRSLQLLNYISHSDNQRFEELIQRIVGQDKSNQQLITTLLQDVQQHTRRDVIKSSMNHMIQQYKPLYNISTQLLQQFDLAKSKSVTDEQFVLIRNRVVNEVIPLLHESDQLIVRGLLSANNPTNMSQLYALLQTFSMNQFYSFLMESLMSVKGESSERFEQIRQRFTLHVEQIMQTLGSANEAVVKNNPVQQDTAQFSMLHARETIKALLLQVTQEERIPLENVQQLVHFINGLQLQTKEEHNLLQAHLQLPGEKIGLPEDLFIQFEGRKSKDDQIDTEFCRILFFLHLNHIKETIIDMNIQKRVITVTVYNQFSDSLSVQMKPLKHLLSKGLERLDYHLSHVRFKPLEEEKPPVQPLTNKRNVRKNKQEGFDLLI